MISPKLIAQDAFHLFWYKLSLVQIVWLTQYLLPACAITLRVRGLSTTCCCVNLFSTRIAFTPHTISCFHGFCFRLFILVESRRRPSTRSITVWVPRESGGMPSAKTSGCHCAAQQTSIFMVGTAVYVTVIADETKNSKAQRRFSSIAAIPFWAWVICHVLCRRKRAAIFLWWKHGTEASVWALCKDRWFIRFQGLLCIATAVSIWSEYPRAR